MKKSESISISILSFRASIHFLSLLGSMTLFRNPSWFPSVSREARIRVHLWLILPPKNHSISQAQSRMSSQTVGWGKMSCFTSSTRSSCSMRAAPPQMNSDE